MQHWDFSDSASWAGYSITGFDTDPGRLEKFVGAGGKPARSIAEAGRSGEVVF